MSAEARRVDRALEAEFTAILQAVPEGYVALVEETPGANSQGATLDEARANLEDAVHLLVEANRTPAKEGLIGGTVIRERLAVSD